MLLNDALRQHLVMRTIFFGSFFSKFCTVLWCFFPVNSCRDISILPSTHLMPEGVHRKAEAYPVLPGPFSEPQRPLWHQSSPWAWWFLSLQPREKDDVWPSVYGCAAVQSEISKQKHSSHPWRRHDEQWHRMEDLLAPCGENKKWRSHILLRYAFVSVSALVLRCYFCISFHCFAY